MFLHPSIKKHLLAWLVFAVISAIYVYPTFNDKSIIAQDGIQFTAGVQQAFDNAKGLPTYWNRYMFSGMPFYMFSGESFLFSSQTMLYINKIFQLPLLQFVSNFTTDNHFAVLFQACATFYILASVLNIHFWIAILAAIAFAFSTNLSVLIFAGHGIKVTSISMFPLLLASILLIFKKRYWLGLLLMVYSLDYIVMQRHYQIIMYVFFAIFILGITFLIEQFKQWKKSNNKKDIIKHLAICILLCCIASGIAVLNSSPALLSTADYTPESIRGGSKLYKANAANTHTSSSSPTDNGVGYDYAFSWSYLKTETFTFITPNIYGGASGGTLDENSNVYKNLTELGINEADALNVTKQFDTFWSDQPFTSGPIFYGVIICLLFLLGCVLIKNWYRTWLIATSVVVIALAWGKNFSVLNYFLYDHLPYYNKFRAHTQAFFVTQLTFPLMAALCLNQILFVEQWTAEKIKKITKTTLILFGGLLGVILLLYVGLDYKSPRDGYFTQQLKQMAGGNASIANGLMDALINDRKAMFKTDILKMAAFIIGLIGIIWLFLNNKIKTQAVLIALSIGIAIDLFPVSLKYLNHDVYQEKQTTTVKETYKTRPIDEQILQDKDPHYRVLDLSVSSPFADASPSVHYRNIGGYFAAKLSSYQDLIEHQISKNNMAVLSMLNTKYIIQNTDKGLSYFINPQAMGPVWFVNNYKIVDDTYTEMESLNNFNPKDIAFIEKRFSDDLKNVPTTLPNTNKDSIVCSQIGVDSIMYQSSTTQTQLAVFSEIYYPKGWKAYIDDKETPIIKTNYVLRALVIPAGTHTILFKFKPEVLGKGKWMQAISVFLYLSIFLFTIFIERKNIIALFKKQTT